MVFKTLHWYICRELLRIFVLTASALTTLLAFGGTFKEVTKRGIEVNQLMSIMMNLMPAMLAYTIPIAALFAAVLVYWRMSTDNELTACRASGISFVAIVMPALFLGVLMASTDLIFVNYVVPVFLQRTERALYSDLGSLMVSQIGRQEKFEFDNVVVYADSAEQKESPDPNTSIVVLRGVAATQLQNGKPTVIVMAEQVELTIRDSHNGEGGVQLSAQFLKGIAFDPKSFKKASGSLDTLLFGGTGRRTLPSMVKSKPKFANLRTLFDYQDDASQFPPVRDVIEKITAALDNEKIADQYLQQWRKIHATGGDKPVIFQVNSYSTSGTDEVRVYAPNAALNYERQMTYREGPDGAQVRVEQYSKGVLRVTFTCGEVDLQLSPSDLPGTGLDVSLLLKNNVKQTNHQFKTDRVATGETEIPGIVMAPSIAAAITPSTGKPTKIDYVGMALEPNSAPSVAKLGVEARAKIQQLLQTIKSELHSRASFAVACLTLVLLGAALGILMRGRNPLAVFVVGFVPAIFLVLLITAGRQVTEGAARNVPTGIALIWAGNVLILTMVAIAYAKLLRH